MSAYKQFSGKTELLIKILLLARIMHNVKAAKIFAKLLSYEENEGEL
jgi:hypothetical protein